MSFRDAAHTVLTQAGEPLHYREITDRALAADLVQTEGATPWETLNARLCVDMKRHGEASAFMRTEPGVFALRSWGLTPEPEPDLRARIVHLPTWAALRGFLIAVDGRPREHLTALRSAIGGLKGESLDFTRPDAWVPEHLDGVARDLALALWNKSKGALNPRYVAHSAGVANRYDLVEEHDDGVLRLTDRGSDFLTNPDGTTTHELDTLEGLSRVLALVAESSPVKSAELRSEFMEWGLKHTAMRSEATFRASLRTRLRNLTDRGLVERQGHSTLITPAGLAALGETPEALVEAPDDEDKDELLDLVREIDEQQRRVRQRIREALYAMDPYAFEHLIKRLLDEMGYDEVEVTKASNDKGIDVVGRIQVGITEVTEVIQAKRQKGNVGRPVLDRLRGSLYRWSAQRGTIITTASFSRGARETAFDVGAAPIQLIDGDRLVQLLVENGIGVKQQPVKLWRFDPEPFGPGHTVGELDDEDTDG